MKRSCQHCQRDTVTIHARGLCSLCYLHHRDEYPRTKLQRPYTTKERALIRREWGKRPAAQVAAELGRELRDVYAAAVRFGASTLRRAYKKVNDALRRQIVRLHATGLSDREIAARVGKGHATVARWLRRAGLPSNCRTVPTDPFPARTRAKMRSIKMNQIKSEGMEEAVAFMRRHAEGRAAAIGMGWPQADTLLEANILNALYEQGPSTGAQLCAAVKAVSHWTLQVMRSLKRRGLVVIRWKEGRHCVYSLAFGLGRTIVGLKAPRPRRDGSPRRSTVREVS